MWVIEKIEISGGFLPGLSVNIPQGLTCIIGARGSGKSTLAEAVRFAICGMSATQKNCADLVQANLAGGALVTITALAEGSNRYTIKRGLKQNPVLLTSDGRAINTVDLDRGTFLPLDAYSSLEIEAIADEVLGDKRRNLLDELRSEQMRTIHLSLGESTRALETNADRIRSAQKTIEDLTEQMEELGDVRAGLNALAPSDRESSADFVRLSRQQQLNQREIAKLDSADRDLRTLGQTLEQLRKESQNVFAARLAEERSANADTLRRYDDLLRASLGPVEKHLSGINTKIRDAQATLAQARQDIAEIHTSHAGELARQTAANQAASEQARVRASLEQQVAKLEALEQQRAELNAELKTLFERRKSLKADHILMRDRISTMRDEVASELQHESGERVRIRVMRNADHLAYQQMLVDGLKGARVRNQNEILATLMQLRPEQRMKKRSQMIFITHNANIPVLAEAELVLVMNSDGRVGVIEKCGTVDDCREQIIDLLEGGREAFDLRSKRYAAG